MREAIETTFPKNIYEKHLTYINKIKFSQRQMDIIAFICNGRSGKKIATFFSISPKTVEYHTHIIMGKLRCASRESIIDFIEKNGKSSLVNKYYSSSLIHTEFKSILKRLSFTKDTPSCDIVRWPSEEDGYNLLSYLIADLKQAGVKVTHESRQKNQSFFSLALEATNGTYRFYLLPKSIFENPQNSYPPNLCAKDLPYKLFISQENLTHQDLPPEFADCDLLNLSSYKNYYFLVFEILKRLFETCPMEQNIANFQHKISALNSSNPKEQSTQFNAQNLPLQKTDSPLKWNRYIVFSVLLCLGIGGICFSHYHTSTFHLGDSEPVRTGSDLVIPTESILLDRTPLLIQIESQFANYPGRIQTIALTGVGGSGKTTLARQYAHQQKRPVVWEINSETKESISISFENLAYVLSKTEDEKKELRALLEIKNSIEREGKIIQWVKDRLKLSKSWVLIYDNIENFNQIQKYFPSDPETWGNGQIIITTRDNHIQNNNLIDATFQIGELSGDQKLQLFEKIMGQDSFHVDIKQFLKQIPSFPLDVVTAAYYLKTTGMPPEKYLEFLKSYNKDFENIQRNILKEMGEYTQTRYSIIALSIDKIVKENKDFRDLLLLVSLLDSQNIPRELLKTFKNDVVVDNFIFHLKKYFLITNQSSSNCRSSFSIHRSTQALSLAYLSQTLSLEKDSTIIKLITETLIKYISTAIDGHDFQSMKILVNHCETFLKHQSVLNDFMTGNVQGELGGLYFYLGRYTNSILNLEESLIKLNKSSTKNYKEVARTLRHLGNFYRDLGDYKKSKDLFEQSHVIYEKHISSDYAGIARSFTYLGLAYRNLGQYEKARGVLIKSLQIYEKHVTEPKSKKLGIARALAYLGSVDRILGDYDNAGKHEGESLIIFKEYFPENHQKVGWILCYLGHFYRETKNYDKAKECLEKSYEIYTKQFSVNHLKVAWVSLLLGNLYHEMGDFKNSIKFLNQCLVVYEKEYGKDHIETAKVFRNLGQAYVLDDNFGFAEQLIRKALKIFTKHNHPECCITLESLADLYLKKSALAENQGDRMQADIFKRQAIDTLNQALKIVEIHFPKGSAHMVRLQNKLYLSESKLSL